MQLLPLVGTLTSLLLVLHATSAPRRQEGSGSARVPDESKRLEAWVGAWDAEVSMMGETSRATETCRLECDGHWLITEHTGSFQGQPFQGRGFTGYDAAKGAFSGVWIDSSGGPMSVYTNGHFSADGKSYTATVEGAGMDGKPARFEYRSTFPDARTRTFEILRLDGEKRELEMSIRYTRSR